MNPHKKAAPGATGTAQKVNESTQAIENQAHSISTSKIAKARLVAILANPIYQSLAYLLLILIAFAADWFGGAQ